MFLVEPIQNASYYEKINHLILVKNIMDLLWIPEEKHPTTGSADAARKGDATLRDLEVRLTDS